MVGRSNLVKLAVAVWLLRWAAEELAAYSGRHWQRPGPSPRDSERRPGRLPGPSEDRLRRMSDSRDIT
jgi:hypothetical protein